MPTTLPDPLSELLALSSLDCWEFLHLPIGCFNPSQMASKTPPEGIKLPYFSEKLLKTIGN